MLKKKDDAKHYTPTCWPAVETKHLTEIDLVGT